MRHVFYARLGILCLPSVRVIGFFASFLLALILILVPNPGEAQQISPEQLQMLQQLQQRQGGTVSGQQGQSEINQQPLVLQPLAQPAVPPSPPSRLEQIFSARAGVQLRQFGYEQFGRALSVTVPQTGAVQDDYILGPGDEIMLSLRGQENNEVRAVVDRNGQVLLPRLNPIPASGRSFGSFRQDVEAAVNRAYVATGAFISVARVRQISVLVSGEVNNPGQRTVTGLTSVVDAILLSGGVKKSGSLRNVRVQRGSREFSVDLYALLTDRGSNTNLRLADGDRIRVPVLGPTVAVAGLVRQPGIYELGTGQRSIPVRTLMQQAGGEEVRGSNRLSLLQFDADGRTRLVELRDQAGSVGDSEILFVQLGADQTISQATLSGGIGLAGTYPITESTMLSQLLKAPGALGNSPYTLFGIVSRRDSRTLMRTLVAFTPVAVINGTEDMALQSDDIVRILSVDESRLMIATVRDFSQSQTAQQEALRNPVAATSLSGAQNSNVPAGTGGVASALLASSANGLTESATSQQNSIDALSNRQLPGRALQERQQNANDVQLRQNAEFQGQQQLPQQAGQPGFLRQDPPSQPLARDFQQRAVQSGGYELNREASTFEQVAQQLNVDRLVLVNFLRDHQVTINGAVRGPGIYIAGPTVMLRDLVTAAGGTVNWTDASGVELITTAIDPSTGRSQSNRTRLPLNQMLTNYVIKPQDELRFNQIFTDTDMGIITVQGEVRFTGSYRLIRGERLSDLLARAGGLTNSAYPYGTVFLRRSVAALERDGYLRTAREVENQLVAALTRAGSSRIEPATFTSLQTFVAELRNQQPLGRVSIVADPSVLASQPALDPLLEPGDLVYIPPRPSTVSVLGQVMQPGSFPYRQGESVGDYIARAGGYARFADESQTFVVLPDGTARKIEKSWFRFDAASALPPGSSIVVPRDLMPFDLRQTLIDVSQILSQFAISIASVAVISRQ